MLIYFLPNFGIEPMQFFIFMGCQQQVMTAMHFKQTVSVNQLCKLKWSINSICSTFTASVSTTKLTNSMEISFYIFEIVFILYFHNGGLFELYACVCTLNQSTSFNLPVNKPSIQISWNLQTGTTPNSQLTPFMQFQNNFLNFFYFKYILFQRYSRQ